MKVLHLLADGKWTGPAEPIVDLCVALAQVGVQAELACPSPPPGVSPSLPEKARARGLRPRHDLVLRKGPHPLAGLSDLRRLLGLCGAFDLLHVHSSHDHLIGGLAARLTGRIRVVRTNHRAVPIPSSPGAALLFRGLTDGYITASRAALEADRRRFGLRGWHVAPGMRLDRYRPIPVRGKGFTVGVVARVQRRRRFDVLLEGIRRTRVSDLRVVVLGRGTHREEIAVEPARRMGLTSIFFPGYLEEGYLDALAGFDVLLFLVPGSDGTCRAVREAMLMEKAVIGARRGMIPEIVEDGITGLVIDDTPEEIARAIETLAADRERCREMGRRGRERARERYDVRRQALEVKRVYEELLRPR